MADLYRVSIVFLLLIIPKIIANIVKTIVAISYKDPAMAIVIIII